MIHEFTRHSFHSTVLFCSTRRSWNRKVWSMGYGDAWPEGHTAQVQQFDVARHSAVIIVTISPEYWRRLTRAQRAGLCAHESTHVVRMITMDVGETFLGHEAEANFVEQCTSWL